ncbi:Carotenoid 9-10(9'-10')-cleavage dioxygenase 1 [Nymphaea thermarum]|nr:Carotenoid 9-10(9'-10')-cleavage dioxygenase 1 [Nymphaea thermarum]
MYLNSSGFPSGLYLDLGLGIYEMRFNIKTGEASQKKLSASAVDFPRINENYTGRARDLLTTTTRISREARSYNDEDLRLSAVKQQPTSSSTRLSVSPQA